MNLGNVLAGAAQGFLATGSPIGAGVGAVAGAFGGSSATGGASSTLSAVGTPQPSLSCHSR